jgi:pyrophosphatase PpaX
MAGSERNLSGLNLDYVQNLIFDLDGTLIDSSDGVVEATNYALQLLGEHSRSREEIIKYIGYPLEEMFRTFSDKSYETFWNHFQEKGKTAIADSARLIDGADQVLRELYRRKYHIGIGSTKIRIHIEKILNKYNWSKLISVYAGADDVERVKPDPEIFIKLKDILGGDRNDTLVIGDTANDIYAARGASLPSVAVRSPFGQDGALEKSNPDIIIDSLTELPGILK